MTDKDDTIKFENLLEGKIRLLILYQHARR